MIITYMEMTQAELDAWVKALTSGEYVQGKGSLHQVECVDDKEFHSFCCLGVFCELKKDELTVEEISKLNNGLLISYNNDTSLLPSIFVQKYGTALIPIGDLSFEDQAKVNRYRSIVDELCTENFHISLMTLNDAGVSFEVIAKLLIKHVKIKDPT